MVWPYPGCDVILFQDAAFVIIFVRTSNATILNYKFAISELVRIPAVKS